MHHYYSKSEIIELIIMIFPTFRPKETGDYKYLEYYYNAPKRCNKDNIDYKDIKEKIDVNKKVEERLKKSLERFLTSLDNNLTKSLFEFYPNSTVDEAIDYIEDDTDETFQKRKYFNRFEMQFLVYSILREKENPILKIITKPQSVKSQDIKNFTVGFLGFINDVRFKEVDEEDYEENYEEYDEGYYKEGDDENDVKVGQWYQLERKFLSEGETINTNNGGRVIAFLQYFDFISIRFRLYEFIEKIKTITDKLIPVDELSEIPCLYDSGVDTVTHGMLSGLDYSDAGDIMHEVESYLTVPLDNYLTSKSFSEIRLKYDEDYAELLKNLK